MRSPRVVSLLPGATEIVAALAPESLVAVSHECDHPDFVQALPRVTSTPLDPSLPSERIDAQVRQLRDAGRPVIAVEAAALRSADPDIIVTQDLCQVCAVSDGQVYRLADALPRQVQVVTLTGRSLTGVLEDMRRVGDALDRPVAADRLVNELNGRLDRLHGSAPARRPRVVCIEWLAPVYLAGHWVPELVAAAGGLDVGASAGAHSTVSSWEAVAALEPEVVVIMLCGFGVERARLELELLDAATPDSAPSTLLDGRAVWLLDGNAYTSRPGPRLVDGAERLHHALAGIECPGLIRWRPGHRALIRG
jgi:iron complex transport system substrate-binding protein